MKKVLLLPLAILALCVVGILVSDMMQPNDENTTTTTNTPKKATKLAESETLEFQEKIDNYFALNPDEASTFKRMAVYPIKASTKYLADHKDLGEYLNLKEALASKAVRILEKGNTSGGRVAVTPTNIMPGNLMELPVEEQEAYSDGASVNTLIIENTSNDTVYIMAGDVVQGGRQDRVIAQDLMIPPNSGKQEIPVFCVESNRWNYRNTPAQSTSNNDGIYAFTGYFNVASNSVRYAAKFEQNQQEVWNEVGHITAKHQAQTSTNTYGALSQSKGFQNESRAYLEYFKNLFNENEDVVGVIVVSGNRVMACDIFATPELFQKQYELLLHSYVTDAVTYGKDLNLSQEEVAQYFDEEVVTNYFENQENQELEKAAKFVQQQRIIHFTDLGKK